jgi:transposase-like protein
MEKMCPRCDASEGQMLDGKNKSGTQKILCRFCKKSYTLNPKSKAYNDDVRKEALKLLLAGISGRRVGQLLGFSKANVYNWCKDVKKTK